MRVILLTLLLMLSASCVENATQATKGDGTTALVHSTILHALEPEMVQIPGGSFMMGSPAGEGESNEHPQHEVTVGDFAIGKYEVTQSEWQSVMGSNPSNFSSCGERCPVEKVSWDDVQDYIAKLNAKTGKTYRLPTEAEWEYACRGGITEETYCGGNDIDSLAWYSHNHNGKYEPHRVGTKAANRFGLFDMSGNIMEWTCSQYDSAYSGKENTCIKQVNDNRAIRGGSWGSESNWVRAAVRDNGTPTDCYGDLGFRLVKD